MVQLGLDPAGNSITPGYVIFGIFEIAGTNNIYDNSVYIGGTGVASSSNTFALVSNVTSGTRNYVGNNLINARDNASGTGKNYAIALGAPPRLVLLQIIMTCMRPAPVAWLAPSTPPTRQP